MRTTPPTERLYLGIVRTCVRFRLTRDHYHHSTRIHSYSDSARRHLSLDKKADQQVDPWTVLKERSFLARSRRLRSLSPVWSLTTHHRHSRFIAPTAYCRKSWNTL